MQCPMRTALTDVISIMAVSQLFGALDTFYDAPPHEMLLVWRGKIYT